MSTEAISVIEPGLFTTVQDAGRYGYQKFGMPVAGAMDPFAFKAANRLLGNNDNGACLEVTVGGPKLAFLKETQIAITGANLQPRLNKHRLNLWESYIVARGDELDFLGAENGVRAYISVFGGIDVPLVMGSRSTYTKAGIGGFQGRELRSGDVIYSYGEPGAATVRPMCIEPENIPIYGSPQIIRVILGPQHTSFESHGIETFLTSEYSVSLDSDRMGYRLEGPPVNHIDGPDLISDGNACGSIQIPGNGQPIILLSDRGTSGGYTKIATVITSDLGKVAQTMPGDVLIFETVDIAAAVDSLQECENRLATTWKESPKSVLLKVDGEKVEIRPEYAISVDPYLHSTRSDSNKTYIASVKVLEEEFTFNITDLDFD